MKHYYTGKGGKAEILANDQMLKLIDHNIFFDDELKQFGEWIMVGMVTTTTKPLTALMRCGWTPNRVAQLTGWFTGQYLQQLCKNGSIDNSRSDG